MCSSEKKRSSSNVATSPERTVQKLQAPRWSKESTSISSAESPQLPKHKRNSPRTKAYEFYFNGKKPGSPASPNSVNTRFSFGEKKTSSTESTNELTPIKIQRTRSDHTHHRKASVRESIKNCASHHDLPKGEIYCPINTFGMATSAKDLASQIGSTKDKNTGSNDGVDEERQQENSNSSENATKDRKSKRVLNLSPKQWVRNLSLRRSKKHKYRRRASLNVDDLHKIHSNEDIQASVKSQSWQTSITPLEHSFEYLSASEFGRVRLTTAEFSHSICSRYDVSGQFPFFERDTEPNDLGSVQIRLQYFSKRKKFEVSLIRGLNIGREIKGKVKLFVKVCLLPGKIQQKRGRGYHETVNPVFYETFEFTGIKLGHVLDKQLRIKIYNKQGRLSKPSSVREAIIPLSEYDLTAETVVWQHLRLCVMN